MPLSYEVTCVILAGGQAHRMDGADKGWVCLHGQPLVQHVLARLRAQTDGPFLISANRSLGAYRALGYPVLEDQQPGFQGPLMGLLTALRASTTPWTLCAPCDTPFLPLNLLSALSAAQVQVSADIAFAADPQRAHPVLALIRTSLADDLEAYLASGERRVMAWYQRHAWVAVPFADEEAFLNLNTAQDLIRLEAHKGAHD